MRNLKNVRHTHIRVPDHALPLTASAWDTDNGGLICAFGPTESKAVIELRRLPNHAQSLDQSTLIASWDAPCPLPFLSCDKILSLKYLPENHTTCLILAGGDLVLVREEPHDDQDLIEIVGSIDAGISAAAWSPDDELVAIATGADTLLIMTRLFESTADAMISPDDVKISAHVSVGWGKRETQFQGKRAKAMRDPTIPEHVDEGKISPHDNGASTISWRGDGAFLAISRIDVVSESKRRMIRVYSREGVLDSVSEPVDGLEGALSWRPAGNLIASIQRHTDKVDVVFFERNGLRHGQFTLRLDQKAQSDWAKHITLAWNIDSTVLAVSFTDRVQLWTMGNYHYYLKQEILLSTQPYAVQVAWHPENATQLCTHGTKDLLNLIYHLLAGVGSLLPPHDYGLATIIDGQILKITPLRLTNIPPPMALAEVSLPSTAIDVCHNKDASMVAVLRAGAVDYINLQLGSTDVQVEDITKSVSISSYTDSGYRPRQISIIHDDTVVVLLGEPDSLRSSLLIIQHDRVPHLLNLTHSGRIVSLHTDMDRKTLVVQSTQPNETASTFGLLDTDTGIIASETNLPNMCPHAQIWQDGESRLLIGLTAGGILHVDSSASPSQTSSSRLVIRGVTSFMITQAHLIFTTTSHLLKFVHLHDGTLETPLDEPEKDERCRSVERGARLVAVMPSTYSVVLQMPRGNLETIYPRALVSAGIRRALATKDYRKAFFACRSHRVDMNILHDYRPSQFLACVPLFIDQVKKPAHIDLFLSQLREEDVTETLYKDTLASTKTADEKDLLLNSTADSVVTEKSKVNRICVAFLAALVSRQKTHLQNIVTSYVCRLPPDHESALTLISKLRSTSPAEADKVVEHICFLADAYRLYDTALGLYDLDVTLLIAQQSQKDPRDYLPYLQSLQESSELRRKFTIDNDLKRYTKALGWLHDLDVFDEFKRYMTRHELYARAVELVKYDKDRLADTMRLHADWLVVGNRFGEAAIAFEFLQDYNSASDAYKSATLWRESLSCAQLAGQPAEDIQSLARDLAEGLAESKDWADAAKVYADYLNDAEEAAACYCKAYLFSDAIAVIANKRRNDLLITSIDNGLGDAFATLSEMLAEMKTQMTSQLSRLRELRVKKALDPLAFFDDAPGAGPSASNDIPDDISLAASSTATTSAGTFLTRYTHRTTSTLATNTTNRTSKNRRREERKRARGKKGSVYEEEYLVASTGRLVERLNSIGVDVGRVISGCVRRGMRERAVALQRLAEDVVALAAEVVPEAFEVAAREVDKETVEANAEVEGRLELVMPVVKKFEGLGLIA